MKKVVVLGSTGSIGVNTLDVIRELKNQFRVVGLSAHRNMSLITKQIREFQPRAVAVSDTPSAQKLEHTLSKWKKRPAVWNHSDGMERLAQMKEADLVICGVVGSHGLLSLIAALKAGKTVGLANKEALIVAGKIIMDLSRKHNARILPVDSEHSAIFQCLQGHGSKQIARLILTASGGPFYRYQKDLDSITVKEALRHPTWKMGAKISIDSATLMNKGLEAIEAHHLFGVPMEKISILIHTESIVHSLVEFTDGSMLAQLSHPDMRLPIQYVLTYPERAPSRLKRLSLEDVKELHFAAPDFSKFPCLELALKAGKMGGTAPVALSSSNEEAVQAFIEGKISFMSIPAIVSQVLKRHNMRNQPTLEDVIQIDEWARTTAQQLISKQEKN